MDSLSEKWEKILESEGMPADLPTDSLGKKVKLGDGLGRKSERQESLEDRGNYHSPTCPINLGHGMDTKIDQPNDRPVEDVVIGMKTSE